MEAIRQEENRTTESKLDVDVSCGVVTIEYIHIVALLIWYRVSASETRATLDLLPFVRVVGDH